MLDLDLSLEGFHTYCKPAADFSPFIIINWPHVFSDSQKTTTQAGVKNKKKATQFVAPCLPPWKQGLGLRCWCAEYGNNLHEDVRHCLWVNFHLKGILKAVILIKSQLTQIMHLKARSVA